MMLISKLLFAAILLGLSFSSAKTNDFSRVKFSGFLSTFNVEQKYSISKMYFSPKEPKQGEAVRVFVELSSEFDGHSDVKSIVSLSYEGSSIKMQNKSGSLWVSESVILHESGVKTFEASLFLENSDLSEKARATLLIIKKDIEILNGKISRETDPYKKLELETERNNKLWQKGELEAQLEALKRVVASQTASLNVIKNPGSTIYPDIFSAEPSYGNISGGTMVVLSGANLSSTSRLRIGGVELEAQDLTITATSVSFTTPALAKGMYDIEIENSISGKTIKTSLINAFYAIDGYSEGPSDSYPVAFAGFPVQTKSETSVALNGSQSYSPSNETLSYHWTVVSRPEGALTTDGTFDDPALASPNFIASAAGNYVVSLVVSTSTKSSVPSLNVITVGPKDPITLTPSNIYGMVQRDGVFIGSFKACNNLGNDLSYQIYNTTQIAFISGFKRGVISRNSCSYFQFSTTLYGSTALNISLPFTVDTYPTFTKIIEVQVVPRTTPNVSLLAGFPQAQWSGERDLEVLSTNAYVPLYGTYDEASLTPVVVKNLGNSPIHILNPPTIVHLSGSSNVFSTDFPGTEGLLIDSHDSVVLNIISGPGTFGEGDVAKALLQWDLGNGDSRTLSLQTWKLPPPSVTSRTTSLGVGNVGGIVDGMLLAPTDFFGAGVEFQFGEISSVTITDNANGTLSLLGATVPFLIGSNDFVKIDGLELLPSFTSNVAGTFEGKISVKVKGYLAPFEYVLQASFDEP